MPALDRRQRRGCSPTGRGVRAGPEPAAETAGGLGAAAAVHKQGAQSLEPTCPLPIPPQDPRRFSDDGVQLRSSDLLSPLDGSQDLLLVLESGGWGMER